MEKVYHIQTPERAETFLIDCIRPEGAPGPESGGSLSYRPGEGFYWTLWAKEDGPKAVYTAPNAPVNRDSCLELFLDCFPTAENRRYLNLEVNSLATVHCAFGSGRGNRAKLTELGLPQPEARVTKGPGGWRLDGLLPESTIAALYGREVGFQNGDVLRGNFYKCGDETAAPHWRSWNEVGRLDFHTPEYFGKLIMEL